MTAAARALLAAALLTGAPLQAQTVTDLLKGKVASTVVKAGLGSIAPDVLRITDARLDAALNGLGQERLLKADLRRTLAAVRTPEDFARCHSLVSDAPEFRDARERLANELVGKSPAEADALLAQYRAQLQGLLVSGCGPDPQTLTDQLRRDLEHEAEQKAAAAVGLDAKVYASIKQRVTPFCTAPEALRKAAYSSGLVLPGSEVSRLMYPAEEARILAPRCAQLTAALEGAR